MDMRGVKWMFMLLLALGTITPVAMAQDDAYTTPARAKKLREKELKERAELRQRMAERLKEQQRKEAEQRQREEREYQAYQDKVDDWYNRRGSGLSSEEEMEANLDQLESRKYGDEQSYRSHTSRKGGKYAQRLRRFSDLEDDVIILKGRNNGSRIYVLDQEYYDPWTSSYYGRDWDNGVNIIINNGPYWGLGWRSSMYYPPYRWNWSLSWGYPWYDHWYEPWYYGGWSWGGYYGSYYGYDPYGYWAGGYWGGGYWGGYYDSYWRGYNHGRWDEGYSSSARIPYSRYGRGGGYYGSTPRSSSGEAYRTRSNAHNQIYGRALGNSSVTDRGYYNRSGQYVDRSGNTSRNNSGNMRYNGNTTTRNGGSNSRWNRSGNTYQRSENRTSTTRSGGYSSGSSTSSNSGSSGTTTRNGGGSNRRTR